MPMLAFFPWLRLEATHDFGPFSLVRWEHGNEPAGLRTPTPDPALQATLDAAFQPFYAIGDIQVQQAVLLRINNHTLTDDLNENERDQAFLFGDLTTFAGLSRRAFFEPFGSNYCNTDSFRLIVQRFSTMPGRTAVISRRRDGGTLAGIAEDAYREFAPLHVPTNDVTLLDHGLLHALAAAMEHQEWPSIEESIFWFNRANSDSPSVPEHAEAVMSAGAFERLFNLRHGREDELVAQFVPLMAPAAEMPARLATRIPHGRFAADVSVREAWIRDFFRLRADPAHGRRDAYPSVWSLKEHLLLGALAFPVALKLRLGRAGLYEITEDDRDRVDLFERLASEDAFAHLGMPLRERPPPAWQRVRERQMWDRIHAQIRQQLRDSQDPE